MCIPARLTGVSGDDGFGLGTAFALGLFLLKFAGGGFFEERILFHLLLDKGLKFQGRRLQQRQRLLQLRRKDLLQRKFFYSNCQVIDSNRWLFG